MALTVYSTACLWHRNKRTNSSDPSRIGYCPLLCVQNLLCFQGEGLLCLFIDYIHFQIITILEFLIFVFKHVLVNKYKMKFEYHNHKDKLLISFKHTRKNNPKLYPLSIIVLKYLYKIKQNSYLQMILKSTKVNNIKFSYYLCSGDIRKKYIKFKLLNSWETKNSKRDV